jgi:hypothetical protein
MRHGVSASPRALWRALALLAFFDVFGLFGCAHDLPGWKQATTPHFRLYTDQKSRSFEWVLDRLEHVHVGLTNSLFTQQTELPPMEVFLFSPSEFHELLGPVGGVAMPGVGRNGVLVLFDGYDPKFVDRTAAHELAHGFIGATFVQPPVWFNEGFATYAESMRVLENAVLFGSNDVGVADEAAGNRLVKVAELFAARPRDFHGVWEIRQYTTAWAVIHYLWHGEQKALRRRFDAFGAALSAEKGAPGGSVRAWEATYPDVPLSAVDERLRAHMHETFGRGRDSVVGFRFQRPDRPQTVLTPADLAYVEQVRTQLRKHRRPDKF